MIIFRKKNKDLQKELIKKCIKNDRKAQITIYNDYAETMFSIAYHMVHHKELAEDLIQEAFISMFQNLKDFKGEVTIGAWLKKITINKCLDYLKKKKINFEDLDLHKVIYIEENNNTDFEEMGSVQEIKREIENLPSGYRTIMNLYLYEGYDHEEIAQILGITSSTSRSQYTRAKNIVKKNMLMRNCNG